MKSIFDLNRFAIAVLLGMLLSSGPFSANGISERDEAYDIGVCTDRGRVNLENEDTCGLFTVGRDMVCVVCDGVGGSVAGSTASRTVFTAVKTYLESEGLGSGLAEINQQLAAAFACADRKVREKAASDSLLKGMATTCLVVVLQNDTLYYGHAGDCRFYVGDSSRLEQITEDDSYMNMLLADGEITEKEAKRHPLRRAIINAIGSRSNELYVNACTEGIPVRDDRYYLLCSDGLYEELSAKRIRKVIERNRDRDSLFVSRELVRSANRAGGNDNISVIFLRRVNHVLSSGLMYKSPL